MRSNLCFRLALLLTTVTGAARAAGGWEQLKVGMTRVEATAVLGEALLTTQARGFTIAIYDDRAEVLLVGGRVASWTAPAGSNSPTPSFAWQTRRSIAPASAAARNAGSRPVEKLHRNPTLPSYRL